MFVRIHYSRLLRETFAYLTVAVHSSQRVFYASSALYHQALVLAEFDTGINFSINVVQSVLQELMHMRTDNQFTLCRYRKCHRSALDIGGGHSC